MALLKWHCEQSGQSLRVICQVSAGGTDFDLVAYLDLIEARHRRRELVEFMRPHIASMSKRANNATRGVQ